MGAIRFFLFSLLLGMVVGARAQDSLRIAPLDSMPGEDVYFAPYYSQEKKRSVNYIVAFTDRDAFLPSYGVHVFNAIRAQVPNLTLPPAVFPATASLRMVGLRSGERFGYLVDGVPFNQDVGKPENLAMNGFEYASISTASSANAMVLFGIPYGGALMLRSRDGSGYVRGTMEANAYVTGAWNENGATTLTSYSLAYMKDFGRLDTRVSYNLSNGDGGDATHHNLKINTGFKFSEKLFLRLILDDRLSVEEEAPSFSRVQNFFQMNLVARYAATDWLEVTGQWVASRRDSSVDFLNMPGSRDDDRSLMNLVANVRKKIGEHISLAGLAGYQAAGLVSQKALTPTVERTLEVQSQSAVLGIDVGFDRLIDLSVKYRHTEYDTVQSGPAGRSIYSVGAGFSFSELLRWNALPFGRLRMSFGDGQVTRFASYPHYSMEVPGAAQASNHWEAGMDATLGESGMEMTINYFNAATDSPIRITGGASTIILATEYIENGWEAVLRYKTAERGRVSNTTGLVLSTIKYGWVPEYTAPVRNIRAALLNETRWKSVFLGILLENTAITGAAEGSSLKVRDITFRVDSPSRASHKRFSFSVSARNLLDFFSSGYDPEKSFLYKSVSGGITLML